MQEGKIHENPRRALWTFTVQDLIGASYSKSYLVVYTYSRRIVVEHELYI